MLVNGFYSRQRLIDNQSQAKAVNRFSHWPPQQLCDSPLIPQETCRSKICAMFQQHIFDDKKGIIIPCAASCIQSLETKSKLSCHPRSHLDHTPFRVVTQPFSIEELGLDGRRRVPRHKAAGRTLRNEVKSNRSSNFFEI